MTDLTEYHEFLEGPKAATHVVIAAHCGSVRWFSDVVMQGWGSR